MVSAILSYYDYFLSNIENFYAEFVEHIHAFPDVSFSIDPSIQNGKRYRLTLPFFLFLFVFVSCFLFSLFSLSSLEKLLSYIIEYQCTFILMIHLYSCVLLFSFCFFVTSRKEHYKRPIKIIFNLTTRAIFLLKRKRNK